jgi:hypothetical protein
MLSIGDENGMFLNSDLIEDVLAEINSVTKIDVRFILSE